MKKLIIYCDGGARGNPGPAGAGAVLYHEGVLVAEISEFLGNRTNNQAEYQALILALKKAKELGAEEVECYLDSELVVKQIKREYKVKNKDLAPLFLEVYNLDLSFKKSSYQHIPREKNKEADKLVNLAVDNSI